MVPINDIRCLAREVGPAFNFQTRESQVSGNPVIQNRIINVECFLKHKCTFYRKYRRCLNEEEIKKKYPKAT